MYIDICLKSIILIIFLFQSKFTSQDFSLVISLCPAQTFQSQASSEQNKKIKKFNSSLYFYFFKFKLTF